jgi:flavin reductase (DIM6/NTAB) family NADH-FMN oxidoreductase RutF
MKHFTNEEIRKLPKIQRANLINSVGGYKPANLIGTRARNKRTNLAIFSSVVHLGANPPLLGFIQRPIGGEVERHTYENISETGVYTINHVHADFVERAHYTSAKFERETSEFAACGLTEEFFGDFAAPFVAESRIKIGLRFVEEIPIKINGTILIVGEIEHLFMPENALFEDGNVDLNAVGDICVSGLETYHEVRQIARLPFARPTELPDFER